MAALHGFDAVDWAALAHAYGAATDVPDLLRALQSPGTAEDARDGLIGTVFHQGTIYPATLPVVVFLAALAGDPQTPERPALVDLLAEHGPALVCNQTTPDPFGVRGRYLPPGTDLAAFTRDARHAFAAACDALLPCLDDPDPALRAAVARAWRVLAPLPDGLAAALRRRLATEDDAASLGAAAGTLAIAGQLGEAERAILLRAGPAARLAAACSAAQSQQPLDPRDLFALQTLWADCWSQDLPRLPDLLDWRAGALLPLLDALAARPEPHWRADAATGYRELTQLSRGATAAAAKGLVALAFRSAEAPAPAAVEDILPEAMQARIGEARTLTGAMRELAAHRPDPAAVETRARRTLAGALAELLTVDRDGSLRVADALVALARADLDLREDAAEALLDAGDARWATLVELAATSGAPVPWIVPLMLAGATREGDDEALGLALAFLRDALRRDPAGTPSHLWSLRDLPAEAARPLLPEVVAALPLVPRPACELIARWKSTDTAAPLRDALAGADAADRPWLHAALGAVTGDASELDRGWAARPQGFFDEHGYLSAWSALPTVAFHRACRDKLTGAAAPAPDRYEQILACRLMLPIDGLASVWPTLRALVDAADTEMHEAVALTIAALEESPDPARRADLVTLLEDIRVVGRRTPFGAALDAPVEAALGLHALGAGRAAALAESCLETLRLAPRCWIWSTTPPRACALLAELGAKDTGILQAVRACCADLLADDRRVRFRTGGKLVAEDEAFRQTLLHAAAALAS